MWLDDNDEPYITSSGADKYTRRYFELHINGIAPSVKTVSITGYNGNSCGGEDGSQSINTLIYCRSNSGFAF
jgi:hypothetical protein